MDVRRQDTLTSVGLLLLRLGMGGYLLTHGLSKLRMLQSGAEFGDPIGIGSQASLLLSTSAEFLCAILVMVGLGTRLAAIVVAINMAVAAFVAHAADPWTMESAAMAFMSGASKSWGSKEPALLYLLGFLPLVFTGPGRFSLDHLVMGRWRGRRRPHA